MGGGVITWRTYMIFNDQVNSISISSLSLYFSRGKQPVLPAISHIPFQARTMESLRLKPLKLNCTKCVLRVNPHKGLWQRRSLTDCVHWQQNHSSFGLDSGFVSFSILYFWCICLFEFHVFPRPAPYQRFPRVCQVVFPVDSTVRAFYFKLC